MTKTSLIAPKNVMNLYDITNITPLVGIEDYTDGIYNEDPLTPHNIAQKNQHNYLLDEIEAKEGFRLLDVGCGLGTLLETARERGIIGTGITISKGQVEKCRSKGLDVQLFNYKHLPFEWNGQFDGIIANGSLEHFCQPEDALQGYQDQIYREMFKIFAGLLNPDSPQKVAITAAHFRNKHINPRKLLRNPFLQIFDKEGFHSSVLHRGYGGYFPIKGQLEKCAENYFTLIKEVDGTKDYRFTSEYWTKEYNKALFTNFKFIRTLAKYFIKRPIHTFWAASSYIGLQSWLWQFRGGENSPVVLYRQTWQRQDCIGKLSKDKKIFQKNLQGDI